MRSSAAVLAFSVTYTVGFELLHLVSVYLFDYWEPSFGDQRNNVITFLWVLPFLSLVATVSFLIGLQMSATFKQLSNRDAAKAGVLSAILAHLLLTLVVVANVAELLPLPTGESLEFVALCGGPSLSAVVAAVLVERWSRG